MRRAALLLGLLGVAAVACTDAGGGGRVAPPPTSTSLVAGSTLAEAGGDRSTTSSTEALTPVVGGTLRLGIARIDTLDPAAASPDSPSESIVADLLYDGLTRVPAGRARAEPAVASSWSSPDGGVTWVFTVSPAARFSDGRAVSATDVQFSLQRVLAQGATSLTATRLDGVRSIQVLDASTVQVVLDRPMAWLPELLSAPAYGILSAAAPDVTSGPFRFAGQDGDVVSLVRAPGRGGYVDQIDLTEHDDLAVALDSFSAGRLDWTLVPASSVDAAAERFGTSGFGPFQAELFFGFNLTRGDGLFADVRFRQAIVSAIDRRAIVNAVYFGAARPLSTVVPAGIAGFDAGRCGAGCAHDVAAARRLLAEAFPGAGSSAGGSSSGGSSAGGSASGGSSAAPRVPTVPLDYADGADEAAVAGIIQQNLAAVGIPVELRPHVPSEFGAFAASGQAGLVSLGWIGVGPTPEDYLERMFRSQSADNLTGFADPAVDTLLGQAAVTLDPSARVALLGQAEAAVLAAAPAVSVAQFQVLAVAGERVHDLRLGVNGTFDGEAVWLSP